jgi:hypothetical protein
MAENYILLDRVTLTVATASVTFSSIPQSGYTDLKIVCSSRTSRTSDTDAIKIRFNGSSSSYTNKVLYGSGSGTASFTGSTDAIGNAYTASDYLAAGLFGSQEFYVPNYTGSAYKSVSVDSVQEANTTTAEMDMIAGLWSNTAAITSVTIVPNVGGNLSAGSTFSLYGLAAVGTTPGATSAPKASGGDIIKTDGTYWYHAFLSTGAFVPATNLTCDVLQVAGGGAGGTAAGGGGAGGVLAFASQALTNGTSYTATVGAGGAGLATYGGPNSGSNSQFSSLTASVGGGGGGGYNGSAYVSGANGGSGGGSAWGTGNTYGTGTSGQGNNGGLGGQDSSGGVARNGGGGGGKGAAGGNGSIGTPPPGGAGVNTVTNWGALSSVLTNTGLGASGYIAGGGGGSGASGAGGAGGSGGGGAGDATSPVSGTAGTGSGGGGGSSVSGSGGSGVIIIRYSAA